MPVHKLYEYMSQDRGHLTESKHDGKLYLEGTFIQAEIRNQNQRVYPLTEISNAVNLIREKIDSGYSVLGELDHPEELTINLDRVSHAITDMWMDGNNGCGKLKVIDSTPNQQVYFNPTESIGIGTTPGEQYQTTFDYASHNTTLSIPTQSIYLRNHPFKTN